MRGSIVKRTGKDGKPLYYITYYASRKKKWETVPPPRTRKHAEKLLAERLSQIHRGEFIEPTRITFEAFKDIWLEKYAQAQVAPSTLSRYLSHFRKNIIPAFGEMELARIGAEDVQGFKAQLIGRGLSPEYVKIHLALIRQMFDFAVDWGYIRTNPARKVKPPTVPKREMDALAPEEVRLFLEHVPVKWYAFFLTAITTGLRMGELLGMKWRNVDWSSGRYFVKEALRRKTEVRPKEFASPKTKESVAPVDLTPACLDALQEHRKRQAEEKLKAGEDYQDQGLIFATEKGASLDHWNAFVIG